MDTDLNYHSDQSDLNYHSENYHSDQNDQTFNTLSSLGIIGYVKEDDNEIKLVHNHNNVDMTRIRTYLLDGFINHQYDHHYLGVIIYMIKNKFDVPIDILQRALVSVYRLIIRLHMIGPASRWKDLNLRRISLVNELKLINLSINHGTSLFLGITNIGEIIKRANDHGYDMNDHIYMNINKNKSKFKERGYEILPLLDPKVVPSGLIISGRGTKNNEVIYFIKYNNRWVEYDDKMTNVIGYFDLINLI